MIYKYVHLFLYIQVSSTFIVIGIIAESMLKLKNDTRNKTFRNAIFEIKDVT